MANDLERLQAALAARMQALGPAAAPSDPRIAPMFEQMQQMLQSTFHQSIAAVADLIAGPEPRAEPTDLSPAHATLIKAYIAAVHAGEGRPGHTIPEIGGLAWYAPAKPLSASEAGRSLLALAPADKAEVATAAYVAWAAAHMGPDGAPLRRVVSDLMRGKLDLTPDQALRMVKAAIREGFGYASFSPNQAVATTLKRHVEANGLTPALRDALSGLRTRMTLGSAENNAEGRKLLSTIDAMLALEQAAPGTEPRFKPKPDAWGKALDAKLATLAFERRAHLTSLLALASKGGDNAKPAKGWLKSAAQELDRVGRDRIGEMLLDVIELYEPGDTLSLENQNTLRALIWLAAMACAEGASRRLEAYARKCLTFSSAHFAYLSLVLGNATVYGFSLMPGTDGVGGLIRLKRRLKRPGEIKTVEKAIAALAAARGMSPGELEEIGLPDFDFAMDGTLDIPVGPASVRLTIAEDGSLKTVWHGADGRPLSGPPAAVKDGHSAELKSFKAHAKEIDETLKAQRLRLERLYLDDRMWRVADWRTRYGEQPLVSGLTRRLIWCFETDGSWVGGLPVGNAILGLDGASLDPADDARVKLWHPMHSETAEVLAWRKRLADLEITQPFKQAHREIYVLTDAERESTVYSNRFAAHIVEQHIFRALCQARGWKCPAFGAWDPGDGRPLKRLDGRDMQVEFWVEPVEATMGDDNFQFRHLSTDQVRFVNLGGEPIPLDQVDPVLFSEMMRDADLFVGVAGIGNDPTWSDHGENAYAAGYWESAAFGTLSETGKTRAAVIKDLLPGLSIAPRCRIEERFLVVQGNIRTYRIHLGSGNIQMEPDNRYLCIVQDRAQGGTTVRLPFEGDTTLSIILSKAFMLVDDDKIKDRSIRSQIGTAAAQ